MHHDLIPYFTTPAFLFVLHDIILGGFISAVIVLSAIGHTLITADPYALSVQCSVFLLITMTYVNLCTCHVCVECPILTNEVCVCKYVF